MNDYGVKLPEDGDTWITPETSAREDSEIRRLQRAKAYPVGERKGVDLQNPPPDCFRCQGRIGICLLGTWNWRACPNAL